MRQVEAQPSMAKTELEGSANQQSPARGKRAKQLETNGATPQSAPRFTTNPTVAPLDLAAPDMPTREEIRERAYFIYVARNGAPGSSDSDWLQAESELVAERCSKFRTSTRRRI